MDPLFNRQRVCYFIFSVFTMKVKLSVVIITLNEERNIGRCLESVAEIADDIIVIDSYSTDRTEEICKAYGVSFIPNPFKGHIEQKNFALDNARYDHVLSLDADEALDDKLRASIATVKENWQSDGYTMNRLTNYCGQWIRHTGWYPDRKLRLVDRRKARWGGRNPHDELKIIENTVPGHLKGDILHYSYYTISEHIAQINFFTTLMAEEAFKKGKKAGIVKLFLSPGIMFIKKYFLQQGFRDGYYGLVISVLSVFYTFLKYVKLRELHKKTH